MSRFTLTAATALLMSASFTQAHAADTEAPVADSVIAQQRAALAAAAVGTGFGPQSPRDIDSLNGANPRLFRPAPDFSRMNLCNIHFHEGAEHKGGEFTDYAGNGDGKGYGTGYLYTGDLSESELSPVDFKVGSEEHGTLEPGDTIEVHFVYSTAEIAPGPTLNSCFSEAINNPQLRVEAQVYVLVNDDDAADFKAQTDVVMINGFHQAAGIPGDTGTPVQYAGSTTGPGFNEKGSPFQVSWSVRPKVQKLSIRSVADWLSGNMFDEDHAHGVRNLVVNEELLSGGGQ